MSELAPGLLVTAPPLRDPNFDRSVVLLASHGETGAFGWIINGKAVMSLSELASRAGVKCDASDGADNRVQVGGPVGREQVWLLYRTADRLSSVPDQFEVSPGVTASSSHRVLEGMLRGTVPRSVRGLMGFAGWGASQLEREIGRGAWLPTRAEASLVFDVSPDDMWHQAYRRAGTSPMHFTSRVVGQS